MNTNENIIDKLKYLGLDFDNIPEVIKDFKPVDYRPSKYEEEHVYKVYRYLNVNDIQILLTKSNRLSNVTEKYKKAVPLYEYLMPENEENIELHTKFLSMLSNMNVSKIEEISKKQELLNKKIPFTVKYEKDYLWQIYYSEDTDSYFMLVPTEDLEQSAFFYLLKKQIEMQGKRKKEKIFVPISYTGYTEKFLTRLQISDIENYIWLFTKEWPLVYEVYDEKDNMSLQIIGKTYIYDDIQSDYRTKLEDKEEALKFYKLLKALFIMQTELPHRYNFKVSATEKGSIEVNFENRRIDYDDLSNFIKEEYLKAEEEKAKLFDDKTIKEKELDNLQKKSEKLEREYLEKERQISTYLECKKTFFGKVKYFFKYKKVSSTKKEENIEEIQEIKHENPNKQEEVKSNYTLEELIEEHKKIDKEEIKIKNLNLDIRALRQKVKNIESKVRNATLYIEEIDKHKKSIFEFWKFANKDKVSELPEAEETSESKETLKKAFDYELDFEDLSEKLDEVQRNNLTADELDSLYLASTYVLKDINKVASGEKITSKDLEEIKQKALSENLLVDKENFDIFGGKLYEDKLQQLANKKHRETERRIFGILDINKNTTIKEYTESLRKIIESLYTAFAKIKINNNVPVYIASEDKELTDIFNRFSIRGFETVQNLLGSKEKSFNLYKINLKENTPILAFTNIAYFQNDNKTLPLGMNISKEILLNSMLINLEFKSNQTENIVTYKTPDDEMSDIAVKTINIEEYDVTI